eukprot:2949248-Prorocentrum_lima.AAC.1
MTSSLVGSEMCIRDSFLTWMQLVQWPPLKLKYVGPPGGDPRDLVKLVWVCLLYTSDAADDM